MAETKKSPAKTARKSGPAASKKDEQLWGTLCHITALAMLLGIPLGNILGPLVVWLIKKDDYPVVNQQGRASLNFQISMTIYLAISAILSIIGIGILLIIGLVIADVIIVIIATIKFSNGEKYVYPLTIEIIK